MLGLIFIYFLGRSFYKLAELYGRSKWGYGILGIVIYYAGSMLGGLIIGIFYAIYVGLENIDNIENKLDGWIGLLVIPFGLLFCWLAYKFIEYRFKKSLEENSVDLDSDILDEDFL
ncbi:MAG: hypothetical protein ACI94Y_002649 [Maribacter sp.]|jgi:hypothetical protein